MLVEPDQTQIDTLRTNYVRGAIDTVTFLLAVEDIWSGVDNSYAQGLYSAGSDGSNEPTLHPERRPRDEDLEHDRARRNIERMILRHGRRHGLSRREVEALTRAFAADDG